MKQFVHGSLIFRICFEQITAQSRQSLMKKYTHFHINEPSTTDINAYGIEIISNKTVLHQTLVGNVYCTTEIRPQGLLITDEQLYICCGNMLYCFSSHDLSLRWQKTINGSECIGIYLYENDLILQGDNCVCRMDTGGKVIWKRYAAEDFFTSIEHVHGFKIRKNYIQIKNWGEKTYYFRPNGRRIKPLSFHHLVVMADQLFSK